MDDFKNIQFDAMEWELTATGVYQKCISFENLTLRLVKFTDDFSEQEWCTNQHTGYVVEGALAIDFDGQVNHYKSGNGLWIRGGPSSRHKVLIASGQTAILFLVESS